MSQYVTKVTQLIALAESAATIGSTEEARTAALMAVRMIAQYKLTVFPSWETPDDAKASKPPSSETDEEGEEKTSYTGPARPRSILRQMAWAKCDRFVVWLQKKYDVSKGTKYPILSTKELTDKEVWDGNITREERAVFHYYLGVELARLRQNGVLESIPGRGFRLAYKKWRKKRGS